jgi:hypothetical protein
LAAKDYSFNSGRNRARARPDCADGRPACRGPAARATAGILAGDRPHPGHRPGASAAIFSLLNAIILRPLPFPNADRIVAVNALVSTDDGRPTLREYRDLSRDTRAFEAWGAYYPSQYNVTGGGPPEALTCTIGSSTMFQVLGVKPILGELWPESVDFTRQYSVVSSHGCGSAGSAAGATSSARPS